MNIKQSFDKQFISLFDNLKAKYGEEMFELCGIGEKHLDINRYSKDFFRNTSATADASIDANANVSDKSVLSWNTESSKPMKKLNGYYILWKSACKKHGVKRANELIENDINGAIRLHDSHLYTIPYCYATSLTNLVNEGMPFYDKIRIGQIKHFKSFINVSLQYVCYMSNMIAGAVGLPDFFVHCEKFIRKDFGNNWFENPFVVDMVKQDFQSWIYSVNFSWRSNQSPFVTISVMDKFWIDGLFGEFIHSDGDSVDAENFMRVQKFFIDEYVVNFKRNIFTFPVLTACLKTNEITKECEDLDFLDWCAEINADVGIFNFYISSSIDSLSNCCRLRSQLNPVKEYTNSFGVGGLDVGSHRCVTVNLPRIAIEARQSQEAFFKLLTERVFVCHDILELHRETLKKLIKANRLPLYSYGHMHLEKQYSTVGFIGIDDCLELMGFDIRTQEGVAFAKEIIKHINNYNQEKQKQTKNIYNVEMIPGESAASNFVKKDKLLFPDFNNPYEIYSNQYIGLTKNVNVIDRIIAQGLFDSDVQGGSILHVNLYDKLSKEQTKKIISTCGRAGVIYFTTIYGYSQCKDCKKTYVGEFEKSPCCNASVGKYMKVVGFISEMENWSKERKQEGLLRVKYRPKEIES